jgi:hypothetical protein
MEFSIGFHQLYCRQNTTYNVRDDRTYAEGNEYDSPYINSLAHDSLECQIAVELTNETRRKGCCCHYIVDDIGELEQVGESDVGLTIEIAPRGRQIHPQFFYRGGVCDLAFLGFRVFVELFLVFSEFVQKAVSTKVNTSRASTSQRSRFHRLCANKTFLFGGHDGFLGPQESDMIILECLVLCEKHRDTPDRKQLNALINR